ncbi:MAG: hypothetical protein H3C62_12550 [Gemmatimonadaceae bacterium]|nr:hypothetical protein [Gemmatimonadaceae bacterium]
MRRSIRFRASITAPLFGIALTVAPPTVGAQAAPPAVRAAGAGANRDPFLAPPEPATAVTATEPMPIFSAEVTAVMLAGPHRYAVLRLSAHELQVVEVGEVIGRWKVVNITPKAVDVVTTYLGRVMPATLTVRRGAATAPAAATTTPVPALPAGAPAADLPLLPPVRTAIPPRSERF